MALTPGNELPSALHAHFDSIRMSNDDQVLFNSIMQGRWIDGTRVYVVSKETLDKGGIFQSLQ